MLVSVMIPAFDEMENLEKLLPRITNVTEMHPEYKFEIYVICRESEDERNLIRLTQLGSTPVKRMPSDSFGDAIRSAIRSIPENSDYTIFMDADGSHNPLTIPRLVAEAISSDSDVVIASRYVAGGTTDNNALLRSMSRVLNYVFGLVLGIQAKDISTNFKIYNSKSLGKVALQCQQFDILEELLLKLQNQSPENFKILEIPDHFYNRDLGESKRKLGPFIIRYVATLIRLKYSAKK